MNDHRSGIDFKNTVFGVQIDTIFLTYFDTFPTCDGVGTQTIIIITDICCRNGLRKRRVNCMPQSQTFVKFVGVNNRTNLRTFTARCTFIFIYKTGISSDACFKMSSLPFELY